MTNAFRAHCSGVRSGKWNASIGYQPRSGASSVSFTAWCPRTSVAPGSARWTILRIGRYSELGSLIGASAENRTVIRSAKSPSPGRGTKVRRKAPTVP